MTSVLIREKQASKFTECVRMCVLAIGSNVSVKMKKRKGSIGLMHAIFRNVGVCMSELYIFMKYSYF